MLRIETQRLVITQFQPDMALAVHRNSLDADNRRFVPDEVFETVEEAAETIAFLIDCYDSDKGPQVYPVMRKDRTCIGHVQAVPLADGEWEIGYHIGADYIRNGYASEAVRAFLPVIMQKLQISKMVGICLAENIASVRVMERCGFEKCFEGMGTYQGAQHRICRFEFRL